MSKYVKSRHTMATRSLGTLCVVAVVVSSHRSRSTQTRSNVHANTATPSSSSVNRTNAAAGPHAWPLDFDMALYMIDGHG